MLLPLNFFLKGVGGIVLNQLFDILSEMESADLIEALNDKRSIVLNLCCIMKLLLPKEMETRVQDFVNFGCQRIEFQSSEK